MARRPGNRRPTRPGEVLGDLLGDDAEDGAATFMVVPHGVALHCPERQMTYVLVAGDPQAGVLRYTPWATEPEPGSKLVLDCADRRFGAVRVTMRVLGPAPQLRSEWRGCAAIRWLSLVAMRRTSDLRRLLKRALGIELVLDADMELLTDRKLRYDAVSGESKLVTLGERTRRRASHVKTPSRPPDRSRKRSSRIVPLSRPPEEEPRPRQRTSQVRNMVRLDERGRPIDPPRATTKRQITTPTWETEPPSGMEWEVEAPAHAPPFGELLEGNAQPPPPAAANRAGNGLLGAHDSERQAAREPGPWPDQTWPPEAAPEAGWPHTTTSPPPPTARVSESWPASAQPPPTAPNSESWPASAQPPPTAPNSESWPASAQPPPTAPNSESWPASAQPPPTAPVSESWPPPKQPPTAPVSESWPPPQPAPTAPVSEAQPATANSGASYGLQPQEAPPHWRFVGRTGPRPAPVYRRQDAAGVMSVNQQQTRMSCGWVGLSHCLFVVAGGAEPPVGTFVDIALPGDPVESVIWVSGYVSRIGIHDQHHRALVEVDITRTREFVPESYLRLVQVWSRVHGDGEQPPGDPPRS